MNRLFGRDKERHQLDELLHSHQPEFIAVYGRRRVGKTFLIKEHLRGSITFYASGVIDKDSATQKNAFRQALEECGASTPRGNSWMDLFLSLKQWLKLRIEDDSPCVVFLDEVPCFDTPNSDFIAALDHFWNTWASDYENMKLIVCGSATSWIINKIIMNYGGLHNRLTHQIFLRPFTLAECEQYSQRRRLGFTQKQLLEAYMALGGIPYYWSFLKKGYSLAQNFDRMFFAENGEMTREFDALYASLFRHPQPHIAIIKALSTKKSGLMRNEILSETGLDDNSTFIKTLKELEQCGFVRKYTCLGKVSKDALYQLMDNFTLFYFKFMQENLNANPNFYNCPKRTRPF